MLPRALNGLREEMVENRRITLGMAAGLSGGHERPRHPQVEKVLRSLGK